ncbi:MAG TPA: helix-turn-helix transcriptional regulator [Candidatus Saccharimonadia bacterium]
MLTGRPNDAQLEMLIAALLKEMSAEAGTSSTEAILRNGLAKGFKRLSRKLPPTFLPQDPDTRKKIALTPHQYRIVWEVPTGKSPKRIALALHLPRDSVRVQLSKVYKKTGVKGCVELRQKMERNQFFFYEE